MFRCPSFGHVAKASSLTFWLLPVPEKPPRIIKGFVLIADIYEKTSSKDDKNYILNVVEEMINPSMYQNCIDYIDKNDISDDIEKIYE